MDSDSSIQNTPNCETQSQNTAIQTVETKETDSLKPIVVGKRPNPGWKNLIPGVNAGGKPKTKEIRQFLIDFLAAKVHGKTQQQLIVERMAKTKPEMIFYYAYGKPTETVEISGRLQLQPVESMSVEQLIADAVARGEMTPDGKLIGK